MALTYPDLDDFDYEKFRDDAKVEVLARAHASVVLSIAGIYENVVWGRYGLRECGDINGESTGEKIAVQVALDWLAEREPAAESRATDDNIVVTKVNPTDRLMPEYEEYRYHVAIVV